MPAAVPMEAGQTISHYRLIEVIGEGGMGVVWKAEDTSLDRQVAIKVLPDSVATDPERLARFEREARAAARLSHPNILQIHDFGSESGVTYAVAELLVGQNLRDRLSETAPGWRKAVETGVAVAEGMAAAHAQGIVHRDLKPENVFISRGGQVKILDFGIARLETSISADGPTQTTPANGTAPGKVLGTVGYMSPEQVRGEPVDARSDLFAFGCVMYEMLAGRRAFSGGSGVETMAAILREEPPEISSTDAAFPAELGRIVQRCLAKSPGERFQSAGDLAFALRSLLSDGVPRQSATVLPRRTPILWSAVALVVLALATLAAWWAGHGNDDAGQADGLDPDRVVVAVFENRTGEPDLDNLGPMASDWITQGLAQTGVVEVVPSMTTLLTVTSGQTEPEPLLGYAEQTGAGIVVSGVYYLQEEALLFQATVTDATQGKVIYSFKPIRGTRPDPMPAIEELRQRVMGFMLTREDPRQEVRGYGTPPQYEAYTEYIAGLEAFGRDNEKTVLHFERAARLDSSMAGPRLFLVYLYGERGDHAKAATTLQSLVEDSERLGPYERLWLDVMLARAQGRYHEALRLLQQAERISPGDLMVKDWIGVCGLFLNRPQFVVDTMAPVDPGDIKDRPIGPYWHGILSDAYHMLGQYRLEQEGVRLATRWYPDLLRLRSEEISVAATLGEMDEVDRIIEEALAVRPADQYHAGHVMLEAARELRAHGYHQESLALANRAVDWCRGRMTGEARSDSLRVFLAETLYQAERWTESLSLFEKLTAEDPDNIDFKGYRGVLAARMGDEPGALAISEALRAASEPGRQVEATLWCARIAALLGDREGAMTLIREAFAQGARFSVRFHREMDYEPLRDYPPFQELLRPKG